MTVRHCLADKGTAWELQLGNESGRDFSLAGTDSKGLEGEGQAGARKRCVCCRPETRAPGGD